jgi:dihydrofolate synthase/folylpolyglutamate synthase
MDFPQTVEWLYEKLPMFQRTGVKAFKKNLNNITYLTENLGNPHQKFPTLHIAGTNGKGSTSHMLASILQEAGLKVGLTTSPHLKDFRERIRVNGEICTEEFIIDFVKNHRNLIEYSRASFFEVAVAMAFDYFAQEKVDIAVIETGLGGRLDSTNIIRPKLSIITNIGLDHTGILGETLPEIASEKAGIIKENTPVVLGESNEEILPVFQKKAAEMNAELILAENFNYPEYESDLKGIYQAKNRRTVLTAIAELRKQGMYIPENAVQKGLANVISNTGLRGRWDILQTQPLIVADTAHNPHGIQEIIKQISETPHEKLHFVLGFVNDKDVRSILKFFPTDATYYFSEPDVPRKLSIEELKKQIPREFQASFHITVKDALEAAKKKAQQEDLIYVGGSTFVVAEVV